MIKVVLPPTHKPTHKHHTAKEWLLTFFDFRLTHTSKEAQELEPLLKQQKNSVFAPNS